MAKSHCSRSILRTGTPRRGHRAQREVIQMEESSPDTHEGDCGAHETPDRYIAQASPPREKPTRAASRRIGCLPAWGSGRRPMGCEGSVRTSKGRTSVCGFIEPVFPSDAEGTSRLVRNCQTLPSGVGSYAGGSMVEAGREAMSTAAIGRFVASSANCPNYGRHLHEPTGRGEVGA